MAKKLINRLTRTETQQNSKVEPDVLRDYSVGAFLTDEENRTLWVNGMPYGNAYISSSATRQPKHAEVFNDFDRNKAEGHYSHVEGGAYVNTVYNNAKITCYETPTNGYKYSVPYTSVLNKMVGVMTSSAMNIPLYTVVNNEGRLDPTNTEELVDSDNRIADIADTPTGVNINSTELNNVIESPYTTPTQTKYYIVNSNTVTAEKLIYFNVATSFSSATTAELPDYCNGKTMYFHYYYAYDGKDGWSEATKDGAHAEGISQAHGVMSHSEGFANRSYEDYSHTEGVGNEVYGLAGHAEGDRNIVTNSAPYAHAEGHMNIAKADSVHVEGRNNLGNNTGAHVEGGRNIVNGIYGHAEGYGNTVNNDYGHVEGQNNIVNGISAHAEGEHTQANSKSSHTEGIGTITINDAEHAEGMYNVSRDGYISSIGIGADNNNRKNALTVLSDGRVYFTKTTEEVNNTVIEYDPFLYDGIRITEDSKSLQRILAEGESKLVEITYAELLDMRGALNLIPGQFYRITDYVTTVNRNTNNISSANNPFDIVVLALSKDTLSENAYAIHKNFNAFGKSIDYKITSSNNFEQKVETDTKYEYKYNTNGTFTRNNPSGAPIVLTGFNENIIPNGKLNIYTSNQITTDANTLISATPGNKVLKTLDNINSYITLTTNSSSQYIFNYLALENALSDNFTTATQSELKSIITNNKCLNSFIKIKECDDSEKKLSAVNDSKKGKVKYIVLCAKDYNISGVIIAERNAENTISNTMTWPEHIFANTSTTTRKYFSKDNDNNLHNTIEINRTTLYNLTSNKWTTIRDLYSTNQQRNITMITTPTSNTKDYEICKFNKNYGSGSVTNTITYNIENGSTTYSANGTDPNNVFISYLKDTYASFVGIDFLDTITEFTNNEFYIVPDNTGRNLPELISNIDGYTLYYAGISYKPSYNLSIISTGNPNGGASVILDVNDEGQFSYIFPNITEIIGNTPKVISNDYISSIRNYYSSDTLTNKICNLPAWKLKYRLDNNADYLIPYSIPEYLTFNNYNIETEVGNNLQDSISYYLKTKINISDLTNNKNVENYAQNWLINTENITGTNATDILDRILKTNYRWDQINLKTNSIINTPTSYVLFNNLINPLSYDDDTFNSELFHSDNLSITNTEADTATKFPDNYVIKNYNSVICSLSNNSNILICNGVSSETNKFSYTNEYGEDLPDNSINYILVNKFNEQTNTVTSIQTDSNVLKYINLTTTTGEDGKENVDATIFARPNNPYSKLIGGDYAAMEFSENWHVTLIEEDINNKFVNKITLNKKDVDGELISLSFFIRLDNTATPTPLIYSNNAKLQYCEDLTTTTGFYIYEYLIPDASIDDTYSNKSKNIDISDNLKTINEVEDYCKNNNKSYAFGNKYIIARNKRLETGNVTIDSTTEDYITYEMYLIDRDIPISLTGDNIDTIYQLDYDSTVTGINRITNVNDGICYDKENVILNNTTYTLLSTTATASIQDFVYKTFKYSVVYNDDNAYVAYKSADTVQEQCILTNTWVEQNYLNENTNGDADINKINTFYNLLNENEDQENIISITKRISNYGVYLYSESTNTENTPQTSGTDTTQPDTTVVAEIKYQSPVYLYIYLKWLCTIQQASKYIKRHIPYYFSKGYIYDMIDEFNNQFQYDATNIQYTVSGVPYYTFSKYTNDIVQDELFSGNIKNNKLYSNGIYQNNVFISSGADSELVMLNNTFNNVNDLFINVNKCNIQNSNFSNLSNITSINTSTDQSGVLNISDSIFSNVVNKTLKPKTYDSSIIKTTLEGEFNSTSNIYPLFALGNMRVYNSMASEIIDATGVYDEGTTISSTVTSSITVTATTTVASSVVNQHNGGSGDGSWNSCWNLTELSYTIKIAPTTKDYVLPLINNRYLDIGYVYGFMYYWYSWHRYNTNRHAPDWQLRFNPNIYITGALSYSKNGIGYSGEWIGNMGEKVTYRCFPVIHIGIDVLNTSTATGTKIIDYDGKKYLQTSEPITINITFPTDTYYSGAGNDAKTTGHSKHVGNIVFSFNKPQFANTNIGINSCILYGGYNSEILDSTVDSTADTIYAYVNTENNYSASTTRTGEQYKNGSSNSLIAVCRDGLLIKNTNDNYILSTAFYSADAGNKYQVGTIYNGINTTDQTNSTNARLTAISSVSPSVGSIDFTQSQTT